MLNLLDLVVLDWQPLDYLVLLEALMVMLPDYLVHLVVTLRCYLYDP
tara:strand:- start:1245 stop:1385 length:141 start_codon:yes stop_codon:yes gene_type:complete